MCISLSVLLTLHRRKGHQMTQCLHHPEIEEQEVLGRMVVDYKMKNNGSDMVR